MKNKLIIVFCCFFLLASKKIFSQILNIENKRFYNDTNEFVGFAKIKANILQNTVKVYEFGNTVQMQYKKNKFRTLFLLDNQLSKVDSQFFANSGYAHLRFSYKLSNRFTVESFVQAQNNRLMKLSLRVLTGVGIRYKLFEKKTIVAYIASIPMYEYEINKSDVMPINAIRLSNYFTTTIQVNDLLFLNSTTYYQPNVSNFSDLRLSEDFSMNFTIKKNMVFKTSLNLLYDTFQPTEVPSLSYKIENGLEIHF